MFRTYGTSYSVGVACVKTQAAVIDIPCILWYLNHDSIPSPLHIIERLQKRNAPYPLYSPALDHVDEGLYVLKYRFSAAEQVSIGITQHRIRSAFDRSSAS